jgi:ATP-binding cassette subfamily F protein 3
MLVERDRESRKSGSVRTFGEPIVRTEGLGAFTYRGPLFTGLDINIKRGEVVTVAGKSGSGKTLLLKNIAGLEPPMEGKIYHLPQIRVGYSPQDMEDVEDLNPNTTVKDMLAQARGLPDLENRMRQLEEKMENDSDSLKTVLSDYQTVTDRYEQLNGYSAEAEMSKLLTDLKVDERATGHINLQTRLNEVSSGQLKRLLLARALFTKPDLAILDEPTSHLDVESVSWLSDFLKSMATAAVVMASNNREFADRTTHTTVGLTDSGRVFVYAGGITKFEAKRDALIESEQGEARIVREKLQQLRITDKAFREVQAYRRSSDMAQVGRALGSRMDKLKDQLGQMPGAQQVYREERVPDVTFSPERQSGTDVIALNQVVKKYGDFTAVDLRSAGPIQIRRGEKWWLKGANGSGKSTLMRMVHSQAIGTDDFSPDSGEIKIGVSVDTGYFNPDTSRLPKSGVLLDVAKDLGNEVNRGRVMAVLNFFGFDGNSINTQDVSTLSHGERQRLKLAGAMMQKPNLLLIDEPTGNFMSEDVQARVSAALKNFPGALVLVSHDPEFVDQVNPDKVLVMPSGTVSPLK